MKRSTRLAKKVTALVLACSLVLGGIGTGAFAAINNRTRDGQWLSAPEIGLPQTVVRKTDTVEKAPETAPSVVFSASDKDATAKTKSPAVVGTEPTAKDGLENLALKGTATSSGVEADTVAASNAIDGIINPDVPNKEQSRWGSTTGHDTKWLQVDLGKACSIQYFVLEWERKNVSDYSVQVSMDGESWTDVYTATDYPAAFSERIDLDEPVQARYAKLVIRTFIDTAEKRDGTSTTWPTVSLYEFEIHGEEVKAEPVNLALDGTASSNGVEAATVAASNAIDGIVNPEAPNAEQSRWGSTYGIGEKWLQVDLKSVSTVEYIVLEWERKNADDYVVQVSTDGESWTDVYTAKQFPADFTERIDLDEPVQARYVKLVIKNFIAEAPKRDGSSVNWPTVSLYEFEIFGQPGEEEPDPDVDLEENIALNKTASANGSETAGFSAAKAVDGVVDRKDSGGKAESRWASPVGNGPHWLKVDFGKEEQVKGVAIEWERRNATSYVIELSNDNASWTTVFTGTKASPSYREVINLPETHTARYLRLTINAFNANSEGVNWNTVSVFELEAYRGDVPVNVNDPATVAASLEITPVQKGDTKLAMPEVPAGFTITFIGADYEQVIGDDMTIYPPVSDTEVKVQFQVAKGSASAKSGDIAVKVPGTMEEPTGANGKPDVIPALREWVGGEGDFTITSATRIVVDEAYAHELINCAYTFAKDYEDVTGRETLVTTGSKADAHSFFLTLDTADGGLGDEGYYLHIGDSLTIEAETAQGAFLATRSVLQILKQNGNSIPQGVTRDYPKFKVRGFMFDVARRPVSLTFVEEIMKTMSWYKMNDFQLHLNDNYIWAENYDSVQDAIDNMYAGFRLESDVIGDNGQMLTSQDLYYTKSDFRNFIKTSKQYGVNIVPEFDSPGHAAAFVKVHPEYAYSGSSSKPVQDNAAMIDVTNPEAVNFVKSVFDEYLEPQYGEEPVFTGDVFHVGADEFYGNAEQYRGYADDILKFVLDKGVTPRIWGSLSAKRGNTPVVAKGVQMDVWSKGWCQPVEMYNLGYDLINILDTNLYMVPGASYYHDYLNAQYLFNSWTPNNFDGTTISACDPQVLGGAFALWNDMTDLSYNGITEYDMFDRLYPSMQVLSEKCWGANTDKTYTEFQKLAGDVSLAPNTNPRHEVESVDNTVISYNFDKGILDASGNGYDAVAVNKVSFVDGKDGKGLELNRKNSYVKLPVENIGPNYSLSMWVKRASDSTQEQILLESDKGKLKAVQKGTGKVGFSRDGEDYSFNYTLPVGEWVKIGIAGQMNKTKLFINDVYVDEISRANTVITRRGVSTAQFGTFVMPLSILGSRTKAFQGVIDDFELAQGNTFVDKSLIPHSKMTATATSETSPASGNDGPASYAIDDDENTIWHTRYSPSKDSLPQSITLTFDQAYTINKYTYLPRTSGNNGYITKYILEVQNDDGTFTKVSSGDWGENGNLKTVTFDPVSTKAVRLTALTGKGGFASAAELNVYQAAN